MSGVRIPPGVPNNKENTMGTWSIILAFWLIFKGIGVLFVNKIKTPNYWGFLGFSIDVFLLIMAGFFASWTWIQFLGIGYLVFSGFSNLQDYGIVEVVFKTKVIAIIMIALSAWLFSAGGAFDSKDQALQTHVGLSEIYENVHGN